MLEGKIARNGCCACARVGMKLGRKGGIDRVEEMWARKAGRKKCFIKACHYKHKITI